jgi:hypothetical protein
MYSLRVSSPKKKNSGCAPAKNTDFLPNVITAKPATECQISEELHPCENYLKILPFCQNTWQDFVIEAILQNRVVTQVQTLLYELCYRKIFACFLHVIFLFYMNFTLDSRYCRRALGGGNWIFVELPLRRVSCSTYLRWGLPKKRGPKYPLCGLFLWLPIAREMVVDFWTV